MTTEPLTRKTISLDPSLSNRAEKRMKALGIRKFSQYVSLLLEKDQRERGALIVVKDEDSSRYGAKE